MRTPSPHHNKNTITMMTVTPTDQAMIDLVRSILRNDKTARYIPFALNVPSGNVFLKDPTTRRHILTKLCEETTRVLNPSFSKRHPQRHSRQDSYGIIFIPAEKHNAVHLHGWLREPRHIVHEAVEVVIKRKTISTKVRVSKPTGYLLEEIKEAFQSDNIWVAHKGQQLLSDVEQDFEALKYLCRKSFETRDWGAAEFLPSHTFKGIEASMGVVGDSSLSEARSQPSNQELLDMDVAMTATLVTLPELSPRERLKKQAKWGDARASRRLLDLECGPGVIFQPVGPRRLVRHKDSAPPSPSPIAA